MIWGWIINAMYFYFVAGVLADDVCKNNGTPLTGTHQKCDCPTGFKGFDCSEKGETNGFSIHLYFFLIIQNDLRETYFLMPTATLCSIIN